MMGPEIGSGNSAHVYGWGTSSVIKLYRQHVDTTLREREYHNAQAVWNAGLTVPQPIEQRDVDGRRGIVFERVTGVTLHRMLIRKPWLVETSGGRMAEIHSEIHQHRVSDLPPQRAMLDDRIRRSSVLSQAERQHVLALLSRLPDGSAACHGDLVPVNILIGSGRACVIDWSQAAQGNPLADVANTIVCLHHGPRPRMAVPAWAIDAVRRRLAFRYVRRYVQLNRSDLAELTAWQSVMAAYRIDKYVEADPGQLQPLLARVRAAASLIP